MKKLIENRERLLIDQVCINPFTVMVGDIVAIDWPLNIGSAEEKIFIEALRNEVVFPSIFLHENIAVAESTQKEVLVMRNDKIPERASLMGMVNKGFQKRFNDNLKYRMENLPGNFRTLVSLHLACIASHLVLVYQSGLDHMGELAVLDYCSRKVQDGWGFIYFRHPHVPIADRPEEPLVDTPLCATVSRGQVNPESNTWEWLNFEVES